MGPATAPSPGDATPVGGSGDQAPGGAPTSSAHQQAGRSAAGIRKARHAGLVVAMGPTIATSPGNATPLGCPRTGPVGSRAPPTPPSSDTRADPTARVPP